MLQLLLHAAQPGLALLQRVLMADVLLQLPVQTLEDLWRHGEAEQGGGAWRSAAVGD